MQVNVLDDDDEHTINMAIEVLTDLFPNCDVVFMVRRAGRPDTEIEWATNCDTETACDIIKDAYEEIKD
jgi:hypothetical protein